MRRAPTHRAGADRWLVSYADLMTLLFAFTMAIYAATPADSRQGAAIGGVLERVFPAPAAGPAVAAGRADDQLHVRLRRDLAAAIGARRLDLARDARGLVVSMPDDAAFPRGSAAATPEARAIIARVGDALRDVPNAVRIEGHTDDLPIRTAKYASNWELSTARASAVVALLVQDVGLDATRLSAAGYGEFHPRHPNDSDEHRARNRRVDLIVLDHDHAAGSAAGAQAAPADLTGGPRAAP